MGCSSSKQLKADDNKTVPMDEGSPSSATSSSQGLSVPQDDQSTLQEAPSQRGIMDGQDMLMAFGGDQSVSTFDPRSLYGGRMGGTIGPGSVSDGNTLSSFYLTDANTDLDTDDESSFWFHNNTDEVFLQIEAPPGKLGLVLDTPINSPPLIFDIKDFSPLRGKLLVGDKLLALDEEDVRFYTAVKISKLLSRKSGNPRRVFTISRNAVH